MPIIHLAARARAGLAPFDSMPAASWTWNRLRRAFPNVLSAVLMPTHVQFSVNVDDPAAARRLLARILGHCQRRFFPGLEIWEPVRQPKIVAEGGPLRRELRYIDLNASRAGLVADPLEHVWSTVRDVMGAVADPWIDARRLARTLREDPVGFAARWHAYVSGDPSVKVDGTPPPRPAHPTRMPTRPLHEILCAAAAALRVPVSSLPSVARGRRLFVALARHQGWTDARVLADSLGITARAVRKIGPVEAAALDAAAMCLGDRRLWGPFDVEWTQTRNGRTPDRAQRPVRAPMRNAVPPDRAQRPIRAATRNGPAPDPTQQRGRAATRNRSAPDRTQ